jgi:hypothetical protein
VISLSLNRYLITFAGTQTAIAYGEISFVTTLQAPIIAHVPIVTPGRIMEFAPIHTSCQMTTFFQISFADQRMSPVAVGGKVVSFE